MAECPACDAEVAPGSRWCGICHANVLDPDAGSLASPGKRLGAHILDLVIPVIAVLLIFFIAAGAGGSSGGGGTGGLVGFVLLLVYAVWALVLFSRGTTPGKRALGLRVIKENGAPAGFLIMLIREWIGKAISAMVFSLGFIWILIDQDNQGWHDKLMSTYVVTH